VTSAGFQALGTREGQRSQLPLDPQALNSPKAVLLDGQASLGNASPRLYGCWASTCPETPTFTVSPQVRQPNLVSLTWHDTQLLWARGHGSVVVVDSGELSDTRRRS
jgi:hypothetical protein